MHSSRKHLKFLFILCAAILLAVLFFGLSGKDYHFSNNAAWIQRERGIRFDDYGIAYAPIDAQTKSKISAATAFSIEIAFKPATMDTRGFNLLLTVHGGRDADQLVIGQYQSYVIAMNGDDYSNRRKTKRIAADILSSPPARVFLTLTTGAEGTALYINGELTKARSDLTLKVPGGDVQTLTLGNSVHGKNSWRGEVFGLALYPVRLEAETVKRHFNAWSKNPTLTFDTVEKPSFLFALDEGKGTEARDQMDRFFKFHIPTGFPVLDKQFLSPLWQDFRADKSFLLDVIVNASGFLPLGFVLCALFIQSGAFTGKKAIFFSAAICFFISFVIEMAQAWIPSRSSQVLDLMLNAIGAFIGAVICRPLLGRIESISLSKTKTPEVYRLNPGQPGKDVEWVPASQVVINRMFEIAKITPEDYVIDLGSGDGRMAIRAAKMGARALGIEFNPRLVELSRKNAAKEGVSDRVTFIQADFFEASFSEATVIALFLREDINLALRPKILEMAPGTRVVSNIFHMGDWKADEVVKVEDEDYYFKNHTVYCWIVPAKLEGTWELPQGELKLKQCFQMITGTLKSGGLSMHVSGKMTGERIDFVAGGKKYAGRVSAGKMEVKAISTL